MVIPEVDEALIDAIYKISQAIWKKHGWLNSPNKAELTVYLEATMLYVNAKEGKDMATHWVQT
mgnify:CR=1 FL=1